MEFEDVISTLEEMVHGKELSFETFKDVMNELRVFFADEFMYQFSDFVETNGDDRVEMRERTDALEDKLRAFDEKTLYEIVRRQGGEGDGDHWEQVVKHMPSGRYLLCHGYYESYYGFDTDGTEYFEVKPVPITVIDYQSVETI